MKSDEVTIARRSEPPAFVKVDMTLTSESNFFVGFAGDISEGGIFLATHDLLPLGTEIDIECHLPDDDSPMRLSAKVRWHRPLEALNKDVPAGFGAEFEELNEDDCERLQRFVADREPLFYPG